MRRLWDARACGRWPGEGGYSTPQLELCQEDRQGCRRNRQRWSHQVRNCQPIRGFATQSRSKAPDPIQFWHSFKLAQLSFHNSPPTFSGLFSEFSPTRTPSPSKWGSCLRWRHSNQGAQTWSSASWSSGGTWTRGWTLGWAFPQPTDTTYWWAKRCSGRVTPGHGKHYKLIKIMMPRVAYTINCADTGDCCSQGHTCCWHQLMSLNTYICGNKKYIPNYNSHPVLSLARYW